MNSWIKFSMKNAGVIFLAMLMIIAGGLYSIFSMKLEQFPNVDIPYLGAEVLYPGATPEQALQDVAKPIEQALSGIKGLKNLYVTAGPNFAAATMEFELTQPMSEAEKEVNSALAAVKLPEGARKPDIHKNGPNAAPVYSFAITANGDQAAIQQYIKEQVKPAFSSIQGIDTIDVQGTSENKVFIKVDADKLKSENLNIDKVKQALLANNLSFPAGQVTIDGKNLNIEAGRKIQSLDELKNIDLIIIDQNMSGMTDAFKSVEEGFGTVGSSVGSLGQGVAELTKGQLLLQGQIEIMQAINGLSTALFADQSSLAALTQQLQANPQQKDNLQPKIDAINKKIQQEQTQINTLQAKLADLQQQTKTAGTDTASALKNMAGSSPTAKSSNNVTTAPSFTIRTIKLASIADVTYGPGNETVITRLNGKPAVVAYVKAQPGTNTVDIVKQVNQQLDKLTLPKGYELTKLRDNSVQIKKSVDGMLREVLFGSLLAVIVTFVFLRNWRATLVAVLSIPLSIFASMIALNWLDYSFNIMTLAGIAVAVGRVVDDSIVVIENIYRRVSVSTERSADMVLQATKEVGQAVTSSTFTTIAVFGPLSFVPGIVGKFFAPFGITVVIALAFSLLVAITVVPLLSRLFLLQMKHEEPGENILQKGYRSLLNWSLNHKLVIGLVAVLMLGGSIALVPRIPQNFLPSEKTVSYGLRVTLPEGTASDKVNQTGAQIESFLSGRPEVKSYQTTIFQDVVRMQIELKNDVSPADTKQFENGMREHTSKLGDGIRAALTPEGITGSGDGLVLVVNGTDLNTLKQAGDILVNAIKDVPGLSNVNTNLGAARDQVSVSIKPEAAASKGMNPAIVAASVRQMIDGDSVTKISLEGRTTEVNVGLKVDNINSLDVIRNQTVTNMIGQQVKLSDIADISVKAGPNSIERLNQQEYVMVKGRFTTDNSSGIQKEVEKRIKTVSLPPGVSYYFEGEAKAMSDGFRNLAIAMGVAVLLVYMVMMIAFGQMMAPFAILFSLPFIFTGGLLGLYVTHEPLGMPAMVGFLMLIGIVVTNAIVLVDRVLQNRNAGMELRVALIEAGATRIRPILMTAIATIGALLPLAVSSDGGVISKSLAIVVISGLMTSTLLTLLIVPVAYEVLDSIRSRLFQRREGQSLSMVHTQVREV